MITTIATIPFIFIFDRWLTNKIT